MLLLLFNQLKALVFEVSFRGSMIAALHPLWAFFAGDDFPIQGTCTDAGGNVIDLTGASAEWKLCTIDDTVVLDFTIGSGITVVSPSTGKLIIAIAAAQSVGIAPGRYRDQLRITTGAGQHSTQWIGFIDVKQPL
jgi:hypothetical protein